MPDCSSEVQDDKINICKIICNLLSKQGCFFSCFFIHFIYFYFWLQVFLWETTKSFQECVSPHNGSELFAYQR